MKAVEAPQKEGKVKPREARHKSWQVIVLDDPVNLMEYVTRTLIRIFGYSKAKAESLMVAVHEQGRAIVWTGGREQGEMYVSQLHSAQLHATLEQNR